jgi:hypothetical protein
MIKKWLSGLRPSRKARKELSAAIPADEGAASGSGQSGAILSGDDSDAGNPQPCGADPAGSREVKPENTMLVRNKFPKQKKSGASG